MKKTALFLVMVFLLTVFSTTAMVPVGAATGAAVTLFEDDFQGGKDASWTWVGSENTNWVIAQKNDSDWLNMNDAANAVLKAGHEKLWRDYTVEYDFYPEHNPSYTGIFFRASENASAQMSGYLLQFMEGSANLYKFANNSNQGVLASSSANVWETGKPQKVKISAIGSEIKVYIDDAEIISVTDSTYAAGCIALRNSGTNIFIDNMVVTDESIPTAPADAIFTESFDSDASLSAWTTIKGSSTWSRVGNWLKATGAETVKGVSVGEDKKVSSIEFDTFITGISSGYTGIYFNTEFKADGNHNNGYLLQFGNGTLTLLKAVNGSWAAERGSVSGIATSNALHHVKIEVGATAITVKLNGETKITYNDAAPYTTGKLAVRNAIHDTYYDNFVVTGTDKYQKLVGTELFKDDFSSDLSKWETVVAVTNPLSIEDGWMKMQHATGDATMLVKAGDANWADYALEFDMKMSSSAGYTGVYVKAEYSEAAARVENGYLVQFSGATVTLFEVAGGELVRPAAATGNTGMAANTKYNVKVYAYGDSIVVKVDDVIVVSYTDAEPYTGGMIGFRNGSQNGFIDNVRVVVEDVVITSASVANGDDDVAADETFTFTFNRPLSAAEKASIKVVKNAGSEEQTITKDWSNTTLTITVPAGLLYSTPYTISGDFNVGGAPFAIAFTTMARPLSISSVTVKNAEGTGILSLNGEVTIDVTITLANLGAATPAKVYVATYANQNVMRAVDIQTVTIAAGNPTVTFEDLATNFVAGDTNQQLKVFVWSDDVNVMPLTQNAVFPAN